MALESLSLRLGIACLPGLLIGLALAGCDRQKAAGPQGNAPAAAAPAPSANAAAPAGAPGRPRYPTGRLDRSHAGTAAPDSPFEDGNGRPVRLSAFRGRPLLVNLWATWCGPCIVEMPSLDALAQRQGEAIKVLTVSQDAEDGRRKVADFFAARSFRRLEPYLDSRMDLMMGLRLDTLPTTILYNAEGREVWRMTGMADWSGERAAGLLREADPD
jgi:thiol-disulfide isomerase/thioredoxin